MQIRQVIKVHFKIRVWNAGKQMFLGLLKAVFL